MDDLDVGNSAMSFMGMEPSEAKGSDEKVGEERLGSSSPLQSFGATLLLGSILFVIIMLIIIALVIIVKRSNPSPKCRERVTKYRRFVFFNPIIRYLVLNAVKLNMSGFVVFKLMGETSDLAVAIAILVMTNGAPLVFCITVSCYKDQLESEVCNKSFGAIYAGKNIADKKHRAGLFPILFFWRRALFIVATVFLFDYPLMQMVAHIFLTMVTFSLLAYDSQAYELPSQRIVEVGSEFTLHMTSIMMSLFMNPAYDEEQKNLQETMSLACMGMLLSLNVIFILHTTCAGCKEKRRRKKLEQQKKKHQENQEKKKQERAKKSGKIVLGVIKEEDEPDEQ